MLPIVSEKPVQPILHNLLIVRITERAGERYSCPVP